ncbi:MAG: HdeA/HdeB family chaperone [Rhodoblastus sp.]
MRKMILPLVAAAAVCAGAPAQAQVKIDMTKVTCGEYLAMDPDASRDFSTWLSGWFSQKANEKSVDIEGLRKNIANVQKWCSSDPKESVFAGLQRAVAKAKQGTPGAVDIDATLFTCKQFVDADPDTKMLLHAWFGGFYSAKKNLTTIDMRYVNRNAKVVQGYCEKNKRQKLMTAIEKKAK